jgi:hypothetical protein
MKAYVAKATDEGLCDAGGKWVAICEAHSTLINTDTKKSAISSDTMEFCDCCTGNCTPFCNNCDQWDA